MKSSVLLREVDQEIPVLSWSGLMNGEDLKTWKLQLAHIVSHGLEK